MKNDTEPTFPDDGGVEIIPPTAGLRAKAATVQDSDPDAVFAAADRAVIDRADAFLDHARTELATLRDLFRAVMDEPEKSDDSLRRVYVITHDLKGQGSSYGFSLMTRVAGLLCVVLRTPSADDGEWRRIAEKHVEALGLVIEHGIRGDGGSLGSKLVARLEHLENPAPG